MTTDTPVQDAPMPSGVEAMSKQELWNWFHRSQCAAVEQSYLREKFFAMTTGLHTARVSLSGNPHAIIEEQRKRMRGLEQQMGEMQKGYDTKLRRALAGAKVAESPAAPAQALALLQRVRDSFLFAEDDGSVGVSSEIDSELFADICALLAPATALVGPAIPVPSRVLARRGES
jgi:hypothetical protein